MEGSGQSQGRGHICPKGHELRITRRCLEEDLGEDPEEYEFEALGRAHPIVRAFRARRSDSTGDGDTIGPGAEEMTLYTLRQGHDHRGATWYDAQSGVVWLVATAFHRSGQPYDAFPYFTELRVDGRIYPAEADIEDLLEDQADQFVERARMVIPLLLREAQARPGEEAAMEIGIEPVSCFVYVVETAEERYFSVSGNVGPEGLELLKALFAPDRNYDDWRSEQRLPTRELDYSRSEMCFSVVVD